MIIIFVIFFILGIILTVILFRALLAGTRKNKLEEQILKQQYEKTNSVSKSQDIESESKNMIDNIKRYKTLYESGAISIDEYNEKVNEILSVIDT